LTRRRGDAEEEAEKTAEKIKTESAESAEILGLRGEAYAKGRRLFRGGFRRGGRKRINS
jgi:hypothetical protein